MVEETRVTLVLAEDGNQKRIAINIDTLPGMLSWADPVRTIESTTFQTRPSEKHCQLHAPETTLWPERTSADTKPGLICTGEEFCTTSFRAQEMVELVEVRRNTGQCIAWHVCPTTLILTPRLISIKTSSMLLSTRLSWRREVLDGLET